MIVVGLVKLGTRRFYVKGYFYNTAYCKGSKRYLRCCKFRQLGCKARAVLCEDTPLREVVIFRPHNHPEDANERTAMKFLNSLKAVCSSGIDLPVKTIYKDVAKTCPEGAQIKPYKSVRSSMSRWKLLAKS